MNLLTAENGVYCVDGQEFSVSLDGAPDPHHATIMQGKSWEQLPFAYTYGPHSRRLWANLIYNPHTNTARWYSTHDAGVLAPWIRNTPGAWILEVYVAWETDLGLAVYSDGIQRY